MFYMFYVVICILRTLVQPEKNMVLNERWFYNGPIFILKIYLEEGAFIMEGYLY